LTSSPTLGLRTAFYRSGERRFSGYVVDIGNFSQRFAVAILVDGCSVQVIRSDACVHQLRNEQIGDGCYGFSCTLQDAVVSNSSVVEARLANLGTLVGAPIALSESSDDASQYFTRGNIRWLGGLRFSGWISGDREPATANLLVDGTLITRVRASTWSHVGTSEADARAVRTFDFYLPEKFADGNAHQLVMVDDVDEDIGGGPLAFLAYADGLRDAVAGRGLSAQEGLRAQLLERLLPMSLPFSHYQGWRERFPVLLGPTVPLACAVIMIGAGATDDTLESLNEQTHNEWVAASMPQTLDPLGLRPKLAQEFLISDGADCDFVVFALAGTLFAPSALRRIASAFVEFPDAQVVYADLDLQSNDGSIWPLAFPSFDYERMLEQGYCSYLFAMRRGTAERSLAAGASNPYRLFNSVLDDATAFHTTIVHLPGPLATLPQFDRNAAGLALSTAASAHLQRKGIRAQATLQPAGILPAVKITRAHDRVATTIIIPSRNRHHLLRNCIECIRPAVERTRAQILVVDNDSSDPDTLNYLTEIERRIATVLRISGEFNFPRLNNYAAEAAHGEVLCLLNNDVNALDEQWLDEMLSRLAERDVGAVGALLVWPSGVVQHGGVVLGPSFAAAHAFNDRLDSDVGYSDLLRVAHECSAVTGACLVTRRRDFLDVGGMDEVQFPVNFNDVDYCLKLRANGKRIVFTPHAKLIRLEAASRGADVKADKEKCFERELRNLRAKWGPILAADPYYSPILSRDPIPFSALAWPAGRMEPRVNRPPIPVQIPPGF
jgi:GT2 family glycosyltransferase